MLHHILRARRVHRGVTQGQLASLVGVARTVICRWESGRVAPGPTRLERLAEALDVPLEELQSLLPRRTSRPARQRGERARPRRPAYPIGARAEHVRALGGFAPRACDEVMARLKEEDYRRLIDHYPRDTRWELLAALQVLRQRSRLVESTLDRLRCPLFVLDDYERAAAGFQRQHAILWEGDGERLMLFGQVRLRAGSSQAYRVDFLLWYRRRGRPGVWLVLELDGKQHKRTPDKDAARAEDIGIPVIRHDNLQTESPWYFEDLIATVREKAEVAAEWVRERRRRGRLLRARRFEQARQRLDAA